MSTRDWYELYVVDEHDRRMELSMQFYKWGDAVPGNAVYELERLEALTRQFQGVIPTHLVDDMLRSNIGESHALLPRSFALGNYFFLLLRADHEVRWGSWNLREWSSLPKEERPDFKLGKEAVLGEPGRRSHGFSSGDDRHAGDRSAAAYPCRTAARWSMRGPA